MFRALRRCESYWLLACVTIMDGTDKMKLQDILDEVPMLDDLVCIFARRPWSLETEAEICPLESDWRVPASISARGLEYFLEVSVAQEVLEAFGGRTPTTDQRRSLLIYYAENDAYPRWLHELNELEASS